MLNTAPMKCLKGPVPRVVATSSGEAAADQEMAHLLLAQELSGISRSEEPGRCPPSFFARRNGPTRPDRMVLKPYWALAFEETTPRHPPAGNVRGPAVGRPPMGRRASPGAATGWGIPPDPQEARGGEIPVR